MNIVPRVNVVESNIKSRLTNFVRRNPPIFLCSKVGEDPQEFLQGLYKVLSVKGIIYRENAELASY